MKGKSNGAFESFMGNIRHEAQIEGQESPRKHAERILRETHEDLDIGIKTRDEAVALIAKLDIAFEIALSVNDAGLLAEASELKRDIGERYPIIPE